MAHSKGPFTVGPTRRSPVRIMDAKSETIALVYLTDPDSRKRTPEFEGNAHLFAASPDMLAALSDAESFIAGFEDDEMQEGIDELLASIRAAIAAAEGRANG